MGLKQPVTGIVATVLMILLSLFYISRYDQAGFAGWGTYYIIGLIPMQVIAGIVWGGKQPSFAASMPQPLRGLIALLLVVVIGGILSYLCWTILGNNIDPPLPQVIFFIIVQVVIAFWWSIIWGGWPFTTYIKSNFLAGLAMLIWCYVLNFILFKIFFNFSFLKGAPIYVASLDPQGMFDGWYAQVFEVTALAGMFVILHFDLWPLTTSPGIMKQPTLGIVFTAVCLVLGGIAMYIGVYGMGIDVVKFLVQVPIPFIFGTIVILNMLEGSLFASMKQPVKGIVSTLAAAVLGTALAQLYAAVAPSVTAQMNSGPPTYDYEIWLASALLAVTFPFLVAHAVYLEFWPLKKAS